MERQIKFRAWDMKPHTGAGTPAKPKMLPWRDVQHMVMWALNDKPGGGTQDRYVFMQYTGLSDRSGQEICEGDVVAMAPHGLPFEVRYYKGAFWLVQPFTRATRLLSNPDTPVRILGNIHQNPEMVAVPA